MIEKMKSDLKMEKDLAFAAEKGQAMFEKMSATLLDTEPTVVGSTAIMFALSKLTACMLKSLMMTGLPVTKRFQNCVFDWSVKLDNDDNYSELQPFDEYVLALMGKRPYKTKEDTFKPFDQEW